MYLQSVADISGNKVLETAKATRDQDQAMERAKPSKSDVAQEARALILHMREAARSQHLERLGTALGVFVTMKFESESNRGKLIMQSVLQARDLGALWIQAARDSFWKGLLATVSSRVCSVREFDLTSNSLDRADEDAVMAILNKMAADGVSRFAVGHAFLKYPSIAAKVVDSITAGCASHHLQYLNLTGTLIGNNGAVELSRALGRRAERWLQELHLSKCNISDAGCIAVIDALLQSFIKCPASIGIVNLSENSITDEALVAIVPSIMKILELHVSAWANMMRSKRMMSASNKQLTSERPDVAFENLSSCSIQELNLACNIISDIGLKHLISCFACKTVLKYKTAAFCRLVQEEQIMESELALLLNSVEMKPVLKNLLIGGNLCSVPAKCNIVHVCKADAAFAQECLSALTKIYPAPQSAQV